MKPDNIKTLFGQREIEPNASAWDALSTRLEKQESRKKRSFAIYWISSTAAAFALVVAGYFSLHSNSFSSTVDQQVVDGDMEQDYMPVENVTTTEFKNLKENTQQNHSKESESIDETKFSKLNTSITSALPKDKSSQHVRKNVNTAAMEKVEGNPMVLHDAVVQPSVIQNSEKIAFDSMTDEADQLLTEALNELEAKDHESRQYTLSADQLLRETEWDMEFDRRHRIDRSLKEKLGEAKKDALAFIGINRE